MQGALQSIAHRSKATCAQLVQPAIGRPADGELGWRYLPVLISINPMHAFHVCVLPASRSDHNRVMGLYGTVKLLWSAECGQQTEQQTCGHCC